MVIDGPASCPKNIRFPVAANMAGNRPRGP